jgi:hypothetical protein
MHVAHLNNPWLLQVVYDTCRTFIMSQYKNLYYQILEPHLAKSTGEKFKHEITAWDQPDLDAVTLCT